MTAPNLNTSRLLLRHWKESDFQPFFKMNSDPTVMKHFPGLLTKDESDELAKKIIQELHTKEYGLWALERKDTQEFIGFTGLHHQDFEASFTPCIEIGWRLCRSAWGQGFATEAAREVIRYSFQDLHLDHLVSFTAKTNLRSIQLMKRLGMHYVQNFEHSKLPKGHPLRLHVLYEL